MYKDDIDYVRMRLNGTVVRDKNAGILICVENVFMQDGTFLIEATSLNADKEPYLISINQLDLSSPPLGNINRNGEVFYVSRLPKRNDWRQGIRKENLALTYEGNLFTYNLSTLKLLKTPVYNKYPTYKRSLLNGLAFSRTFSFNSEKILWYKCRERVGRGVDGVPVLDRKYEWLKEALEDALER